MHLMAGANDEHVHTFPTWAGIGADAPAVDPNTSGAFGAQKLSQQSFVEHRKRHGGAFRHGQHVERIGARGVAQNGSQVRPCVSTGRFQFDRHVESN